MNALNRFADRVLRSELSAQKSANSELHRKLKATRERANQLTVTVKTNRTKLAALRKRVRELEADKVLADETVA